jgi:hypothetical protein
MGGHNRRIWLGGKRKGHANETLNSAIWLECQLPDYVAEPKFADAGIRRTIKEPCDPMHCPASSCAA